MSRDVPLLLLLLVLLLSAAAAALSSALLAGGGGESRERRARNKVGGGGRGGLFSSSPSRAVSDDDDSSSAGGSSSAAAGAAFLLPRSPPSAPASPSSSPPAAAASHEIDALAARVAERLEFLLLRQQAGRSSGGEEGTERAESSDASPPPPPPQSGRPSPSPSAPASRSSSNNSSSSSSSSSSASFRTFFQALAGASVASLLLLGGERLERRKKGSARNRAELLDALRNLDDAAARRLLGQVSLPGWAKFPDFDRCAFANAAIAQLWPYVCLAASEAARDVINPLLEEQRPPWMTRIAITKFELGPRPPTLEGIKVFPASSSSAAAAAALHRRRAPGSAGDSSSSAAEAPGIEGRRRRSGGSGGQSGPPSRQSDSVVLEVDVDWAGSQDIELVVNPLPSLRSHPRSSLFTEKLFAPASRALARAIKLRAGVDSVSASARVRVELGPLEGRLPIVPRLSVALVDFPQLGFDLTLYGGDVTLLPGLEAFLLAVLRDVVLRPYVLPGRLVVDLAERGDEEALGFERPRGMLFVSVEEATRVPRGLDLFSAADCYVKVGTTGGAGGGGKRGGKKKKNEQQQEQGEEEARQQQQLGPWRRTRTVPNCDAPAWRQQLRPLLVRDPSSELVDFVLMDADELGQDDEIGRCSIRIGAVVAALEEREREEEERRRRRRGPRRGLARPPSPVSRPEVIDEGAAAASAAATAPVPASSAASVPAASSAVTVVSSAAPVPAASSAAPVPASSAVTVVSSAAPVPASSAVAFASREEQREGIEDGGEQGDGGFVVVGRATDADVAAASPPSPSSSPPLFVPPPAVVAAADAPPVTDRSSSGAEFFVGVPVDDEETRRALFSPPSPPEGAGGEEAGGEEEDDDEEIEAGGGGGGGGGGAPSPVEVQALRGSGSVDDPLELWIPCPRLSSSSGGPASSFPREWRSGHSSAGASGRRAAASRGAARGCRGCLSAVGSPFLPDGAGRGGRPFVEEGPPLLRVKLSYHAFSEQEIELAGGRGGGGGGRGGGGREGRGDQPETEPAAAAVPPVPSSSLSSSSSSSSRAADILGGGILFVRPRSAKNLRPPPLWRRLLPLPPGRRAAWVVRVAVAGGVSEEGGPVSRGGTSPTFTEPIELVLGAKDLARARRSSTRDGGGGEGESGGGDALVSLQLLDVSSAGVDAEGRRRHARVAGVATVRWRDLLATRRLQGEFPLAQFAPGTEEETLLEREAAAGGEGEGRVESSRRRRSLLRAPPRGYDASTDAGMTTTTSASAASGEEDQQPTLSAELAWFAFV